MYVTVGKGTIVLVSSNKVMDKVAVSCGDVLCDIIEKSEKEMEPDNNCGGVLDRSGVAVLETARSLKAAVKVWVGDSVSVEVDVTEADVECDFVAANMLKDIEIAAENVTVPLA